MKRIFLSSFLAIISLFIFGNSVFALKTNQGDKPDIPDNYDNYIYTESALYCWNKDDNITPNYKVEYGNYYLTFSNSDSENNRSGNADIYVYANNEWFKNATGTENNTYAITNLSQLIATNSNIKYIGVNEELKDIESGFGLPLPTFFNGIKLVIIKILALLSIIMTNLLNNIIFKVMLGFIILSIIIAIIYKLVKKTRKGGK